MVRQRYDTARLLHFLSFVACHNAVDRGYLFCAHFCPLLLLIYASCNHKSNLEMVWSVEISGFLKLEWLLSNWGSRIQGVHL